MIGTRGLAAESSRRRRLSILVLTAFLISMLSQGIGFTALADDSGELPFNVPVAIDKTLNGEAIKEALDKDEFDAVKDDMRFAIHKMSDIETMVIDVEPYVVVKLSDNGTIEFYADEPGWYAIMEELVPKSRAALTFTEVDPLYIYVGPNGVMSSVGMSNSQGTYRIAWGGS
ncbi:MAG: hypothetical protein FWE70_04945, partial [Oscillospiraceae bacterium]|nr:hypothetical protein [Oscillospiraceae bacterium]